MTATALHTAVTVIGNGPVGQTTALLLARWGIRVTLLDARPARDPIGSKAICQQRDILDIWDAIGAGQIIADEGVSLSTARTFHRDVELFALEYADKGFSPFPPFVNISQTRTEEILDTLINTEPLIDVKWNHSVESITQDNQSVSLCCATPNGEITISSDYAVLATGSRSAALRGQLGLSFPGRSFDDKFLICDIRADLPDWKHERRFYFDPEWNPGRQVLIHPCPDSTFRIDWQVPGEFDIDADAASGDMDRRIRRIIGDTDYEIVWNSVYRFHARLVEKMRVGRVLLAGDCAHIVSPFGGRGLNSGVADAENAAWKLAFVLRGWSDESLLDTYSTERHAASAENIDITSATMDFLVPQNEQQRAHRRQVLEDAHTDDTAQASVDSGRLSEPYWYTTSPLTTPTECHPAEGRPPKGFSPRPAPGVLVPDAPVHVSGSADHLRALCRDGLLVLFGDAVDEKSLRDAALGAIRAPIRTCRLSTIDVSGSLRRDLDATDSEVWIIRPDGYIAAVPTGDNLPEVVASMRAAIGALRQDNRSRSEVKVS